MNINLLFARSTVNWVGLWYVFENANVFPCIVLTPSEP